MPPGLRVMVAGARLRNEADRMHLMVCTYACPDCGRDMQKPPPRKCANMDHAMVAWATQPRPTAYWTPGHP